MAKKKEVTPSVNYKTIEDIESVLKLDKEFMNNHTAAEFNSYVDGAVWMMELKNKIIERLKERNKNNLDKIINIENELSSYKELYEGFDVVYKKPRKKKDKKKDKVFDKADDDSEEKVFQDDDYSDVFEDESNEELDLFDDLFEDEDYDE